MDPGRVRGHRDLIQERGEGQRVAKGAVDEPDAEHGDARQEGRQGSEHGQGVLAHARGTDLEQNATTGQGPADETGEET